MGTASLICDNDVTVLDVKDVLYPNLKTQLLLLGVVSLLVRVVIFTAYVQNNGMIGNTNTKATRNGGLYSSQ
jgi:hypothetical protein